MAYSKWTIGGAILAITLEELMSAYGLSVSPTDPRAGSLILNVAM